MLIVFVGLVVGVIAGLFLPNFYPAQYSFYISIAILGSLDSIFGAVRANMEQKFKTAIFVSGFLANTLMAAGLAFIGDKMGIPLYYASIFVFGGRIFENLATIRRLLLKKYFNI
ncbi:MAG: small basic family protein [Peptostreptococcales bacterium]